MQDSCAQVSYRARSTYYQAAWSWQGLECCAQGIDGVPKISQDYNPATWMLEITNTAVENRTGQDFAALYANSDMYRFAQACHLCLTMQCSSICSSIWTEDTAAAGTHIDSLASIDRCCPSRRPSSSTC